MIENLIVYIKNLPHLFSFCTQRLKQTWKWFAISLIIGLVIILALEGFFNFNHTTDIVQVRWLFRISSFIIFSIIIQSIYIAYKYYIRDFVVMKSFHISAVTPTIVIAMLGLITILILGIVIIILKPVNFEASILSFLYYLVILAIFISVTSIILGLLSYAIKHVKLIFIIVSAISFFMVPITYIPNTNLNVVNHIMMLNPLYYFVNGSSQAIVFGTISMSNLPYHLYIIILIGIICVINYALVRHIAIDKYQNQSNQKNYSKKNKEKECLNVKLDK